MKRLPIIITALLLFGALASCIANISTSQPASATDARVTLFTTTKTIPYFSTPTAELITYQNLCGNGKGNYTRFEWPASWETVKNPDGMGDDSLFVSDFMAAIANHLNQTGAPQLLAEDLRLNEYVKVADIREVDLNNNHEPELILALGLERPSQFYGQFIWVMQCLDGEYVFTDFTYRGGLYSGRPEIINVGDINRDGFTEVVAELDWVGSDRMPLIFVLSERDDGEIVSLFRNRDAVNPLASITTVEDVDGDDVQEIILSGRKYHRGSGTRLISIYKWSGQSYIFECSIELEP